MSVQPIWWYVNPHILTFWHSAFLMSWKRNLMSYTLHPLWSQSEDHMPSLNLVKNLNPLFCKIWIFFYISKHNQCIALFRSSVQNLSSCHLFSILWNMYEFWLRFSYLSHPLFPCGSLIYCQWGWVWPQDLNFTCIL